MSLLGALETNRGTGSAMLLRNTSGEVVRIEHILRFATLPREFEGIRIGFVSDLHLGICVPPEWIERAISHLQEARIDLLLLGGDNLWIPDSPLSQRFGELRTKRYHGTPLSELPRAIFKDLASLIAPAIPKEGAFGVLGNHDAWIAPKECVRSLGEKGIVTLVNQVHTIERDGAKLVIVGSDDYWNGVPRLPRFTTRGAREFRILLTHNPDHAAELLKGPEAVWNDHAFDLALCGHTHGGQIKLPFLGALNYNIRNREFGEGLNSGPDGRGVVYTTRGVGVVELPYRINQPGEATVLELRRQ